MSSSSFVFTPAIDDTIRYLYREKGTGKGQVKTFAKVLCIPYWRISRRARIFEVYEPRVKEPVWSDKELRILKKYVRYFPETIQRKLLKRGFKRSVIGIILKRKRLRLLKDLDGYSARALALGFGVDAKVITRWIEANLLKASRRNTKRTAKQGGDIYFIHEADVRDFIIENIGLIDIRKVEKQWFVDIMVNGYKKT